MTQRPRTNRDAYEARDANGEITGSLHLRDWSRFAQTLRLIPRDAESLLDCGCDRRHWLHYVLQHRLLKRHLGIDVSVARVTEPRQRYPELALKTGCLEDLDESNGRYSVVTCLEVLEHIPCWEDVFHQILAVAERRVVVTVPYREQIQTTPCVHCGKAAPVSGHLHTFSEDTFPLVAGWRRSYRYINDFGSAHPVLLARIYRRILPCRAWLAAVYQREPSPQSVRAPGRADLEESS